MRLLREVFLPHRWRSRATHASLRAVGRRWAPPRCALACRAKRCEAPPSRAGRARFRRRGWAPCAGARVTCGVLLCDWHCSNIDFGDVACEVDRGRHMMLAMGKQRRDRDTGKGDIVAARRHKTAVVIHQRWGRDVRGVRRGRYLSALLEFFNRKTRVLQRVQVVIGHLASMASHTLEEIDAERHKVFGIMMGKQYRKIVGFDANAEMVRRMPKHQDALVGPRRRRRRPTSFGRHVAGTVEHRGRRCRPRCSGPRSRRRAWWRLQDRNDEETRCWSCHWLRSSQAASHGWGRSSAATPQSGSSTSW